MTPRRALSPLTLLLVSLLCYGFVLVWTQNVAFDTTTTFEELSTPFSPALLKILTGGNFSVSVKPSQVTTEQPLVSTQSGLIIQNELNASSTTASPQDIGTIPIPATTESLSTIDTIEADTEDITRAPPSITTNNVINTPTQGKKGNADLGIMSDDAAAMVDDEGGITASTSVSDNINKVSSGATMAEDTMTSTGVSAIRDGAALPRTMERTSWAIHTGGTMTWRVKLQSRLSREEAVITFFEEACDVIIKKLHMKDVVIMWGAERTAVKCL